MGRGPRMREDNDLDSPVKSGRICVRWGKRMGMDSRIAAGTTEGGMGCRMCEENGRVHPLKGEGKGRDEGANLLGKGIECRGTVADALGRAASLLLRLDREKARKVE